LYFSGKGVGHEKAHLESFATNRRLKAFLDGSMSRKQLYVDNI